jgi:hypothetical protein
MQTYLILALERFILDENILRLSDPFPLETFKTSPVSASRTIVINLRDALPLLNLNSAVGCRETSFEALLLTNNEEEPKNREPPNGIPGWEWRMTSSENLHCNMAEKKTDKKSAVKIQEPH